MSCNKIIWFPLLLAVFIYETALSSALGSLAQFSGIECEYLGPDTVYVDSSCTAPLFWDESNNPDCEATNPGATIIRRDLQSISGGFQIGDLVPAGTDVVVTYRVTDNMGNEEFFSFTIHFTDTIPPEFVNHTLPPDTTVLNSNDLEPAMVVATDNCDSTGATVEINFLDSPFPDACTGGEWTRTYTATDAFGNQAFYIQTITQLPDTAAPVFLVPPVSAAADCEDIPSAFSLWLQEQYDNVVIENPSGGYVSLSDNAPDPNSLIGFCGILAIDFFASDSCGNQSIASVAFEVVDTVAPVIIEPATDLFTNCNQGGGMNDLQTWIENNGFSIGEDNCSELTWELLPSPGSPDFICNDTLQVVWRATDACGNFTETTAGVFISDTTGPVFTTLPQDMILNCENPDLESLFYNWLDSLGGASVIDDCSDSGDISHIYRSNGLDQTAGQLWNLLMADFQGECLDSVLINGQFLSSVLAHIEVEFVALDFCNNESSAFANFTITDTVPPEITSAPLDTVLNCMQEAEVQAALQQWLNSGAGIEGVDGCSEVIKGYEGDFNLLWQAFLASSDTLCGNNGRVEVLFFLEDECGNRTYADELVTFSTVDTIPPILVNEPSDTIFLCNPAIDNQIESWIGNYSGAGFSDLCSGVLGVSFTWTLSNGQMGEGNTETGPFPTARSMLCSLTINLNYLVSDECGNTLEFSASIEILDESPPSFEGSPDTVFYNCNEDLSQLIATISDPCSDFSVGFSDSLISGQWIGCGDFEQVIQRRINAEDLCGNRSEFIQTVIVGDFESPFFESPSDITIDCDLIDDTGLTGVPVNVSDNCFTAGELIITYEDIFPDSICNPEVQRIWRVEDPCGNFSLDTQRIQLVDTIAPQIITEPVLLVLQCGQPDNESLLQSWVDQNGGALINDLCSPVFSFLALSGSYDPSDPVSFPGEMPVLSELLDCDSITGNEIEVFSVDFVFYDLCFNTTVFNSQIQLTDEEAPVFSHCPDRVTVMADSSCQGQFFLPSFSVFDECGLATESIFMTDSAFLSSADPGSSNAVVNPVELSFPGLYDPLRPLISISLEIELIGVDGEQPTEYFEIYDQSGRFWGQTNPTDEQCGYSSTTLIFNDIELINSWSADDAIRFDLVPNFNDSLSGSFFINDICDPGLVVGNVSIERVEDIRTTAEIRIGYGESISVDEFPAGGITLAAGNHPAIISATDCSGNRSHCRFEIHVPGTDPPLIECAEPSVLFLSDTSCTVTLQLPDIGYQSPCQAYGINVYSHEPDSFELLHFFTHPDLGDYQPGELVLSFDSLEKGGTDFVSLYINFRADIDSQFAFFEVLTAGGEFLGEIKEGGSNILVPGNCSQEGTALIEIPVGLFNQELVNGLFQITVRPFGDIPIPPGGPGSGINPCNGSVTGEGQTDGISSLRAYLSYHPVSVKVSFDGPEPISPLNLYLGEDLPEVELQAGKSFIIYEVSDPWGNTDSCSVEVHVEDSIPPVAICKNARIEVIPSVLDTFVLNPSLVDGGSFDNCAVVSRSVNPSKFTCESVGVDTTVILTVFDMAGNSSSCTAFLRIESETPQPSFLLDLCQPDTLYLFSNAPGDPTLFSYSWSGPQGFTSSSPNPVVSGIGQANSGIYQVTITGFGGCTASASVNVSISTIATPQLQAENSVVCEGNQIHLTASLYTGNITYKWYSGTPPSGVLLGETPEPSFSTSLPQGNHRFYVIVENPDCSSNPSNLVNVEVVEEPVAVIEPSFVRVCSGNQLALSSPLGPSFDYSWTGPAGFVSDMQSPVVTPSATQSNAGIYNLVVTLGTCTSRTVSAEVVVDESPPKPILQGSRILCVGDSLHLRVTNIPIATRYTWILPDGSEIFTTTGQLVISNTNTGLSGEWRVLVSFGQCDSPLSEPFVINVEDVPSVSVMNNSPVCEGDTVVLIANNIPGADYQWTGPGGQIFTGDTLRAVLPTGIYQLRVETEGGCVAVAETSVSVKVRPLIDAIVKQGEECADGQSDFCFQSFVTPPDNGNYSYQWTGPNNFSSTSANPCIPNASESDNGFYYLQVTLDGCTSPVDSTLLDVKNIGRQPFLGSGFNRYCEGDSIVLYSDYAAGPGINFHWIGPSGVQITTDSIFVIEGSTVDDEGIYSVFVVVEQCTTNLSEEIEIAVNPVPLRPTLSGGGTFCEGDSIRLWTEGIPGVVYTWTGPVGLDQNLADQNLWPATVDLTGSYRVVATLSGCVSDPSLPQNVVVNPLPPRPSIELSADRVCIDDLSTVIEVCLNTDSVTGGSSFWFYINNELVNPILTTNSICTEISGINIDEAGINTLQIRAENLGCLSAFSQPVTFRADTIPDEEAFAGEDLIVCRGDDIGLMADFPQFSTGMWSGLHSNISFEDSGMPLSDVSGLQAGINNLIWTLSNGSCLNFSSDTMAVEYLDFPFAVNDTLSVIPGNNAVLDILSNDVFPAPVVVSIVNVDGTGSAEIIDENQLFVRTNERWAGVLRITYRICLQSCPDKCSEATVYVLAGDADNCSPPNIFTPNSDGINDAFIIPCLASERYIRSELKIYDQWGSELFSASPYQNDWEGTHNGRPLPNGTYFYVLDFGDGRSPISGFVVIKR